MLVHPEGGVHSVEMDSSLPVCLCACPADSDEPLPAMCLPASAWVLGPPQPIGLVLCEPWAVSATCPGGYACQVCGLVPVVLVFG